MADRAFINIISAEHGHLHSAFERVSETLFFGYVLDPQELHKRFVVEILLDGVPIKLLRAEQYDPKLRNRALWRRLLRIRIRREACLVGPSPSH